MKKHSDGTEDWEDQRRKIIGLGESSLRKSYYPELREKVAELEKKNEELQAAYEELTSTEEELRGNYDTLARHEQDLRESEEKYRNLIDNTFDGVIIHQNSVIVYANRTALEMIGCTGPCDLIGRSIFTVTDPAFREIVAQRASGALKEVQLPRNERFLRNDGTGLDVEVVAVPAIWESKPAVQVAFRDVSSQKKAEDALQESERRYRTLVETTDTGFVIIDAEGRVVNANQKYVELSGHTTLDAILGRNVLDWTADYEREKNARAVEECARTGIIRNFEIDYISPAGAITPIEINATVVLSGDTVRILTLCRDITERRKAEKALRDSEAFYRTVFNTTGSASIIIDRATLIMQANEGFARLSGYTTEELIGKHYWKEFVTREDYLRMKEQYFGRVRNPESAPTSYEFRFISRSGTVLYCIMHVAIVPGTGQIIISVVDISDRVIAEQELRSAKNHLEAIYEGSPDLIFVHAADGHIIDVNENVLSAFGVSREEIISVSPAVTSGKGYTAEMAMRYFHDALGNGQAEFDWVGRKKTGEEFPLEIRLRRIESVNERGEVEPRVLAIARDVTERRMAERALDQARKKLGLLNTVIFQDIQSTVFALSAYIQLAGSSRDEAKTKTYSDKEALLVNKIMGSLNFTKNYQDLGIHPPRWQSVKQVFLYALSHLDSLRISRNMAVEGLEIYADPLLEKVFFNLAENSFIHGQRVTEVTLDYRETPEGVVITLADNGIGIPAEEKAKIFLQGSGKNAGFGLFLASEILSITGIRIRETGEEGRGARFEIFVPTGIYRFTDTRV